MSARILPLRELGSTGVKVTSLGLGCAGFGELYEKLTEAQATGVMQAAWDSGVRYFDTAPWYGRGLSELRLGNFLRQKLREEKGASRNLVISTKIGRYLTPVPDPATFNTAPWAGGLAQTVHFDYTYDGVMRSYAESRQRLSGAHVDILAVHDLDADYHKDKLPHFIDQLAGDNNTCQRGGGWKAMEDLRRIGGVRALGFGLNIRNEVLITEFLRRFKPDFFVIAGSYTLLDQDIIDRQFKECEARGVGYILGAPFASGVLAMDWSKEDEEAATSASPATAKKGKPAMKYMYGAIPDTIVTKMRGIAGHAAKHGVSVPCAALNFPLGHPRVASVIPGAASAKQSRQNAKWIRQGARGAIPAFFWDDLKASQLLHPAAPLPESRKAS